MKVLVGCLFSALLSCIYADLYAQLTPSAIQGSVLTENNLVAEQATIVLLKYSDSSIVNSAIISKNGLFKFTDISTGTYLLLVSKIGYEKLYTGPYQVAAGQTFTAKPIVLKQTTEHLTEVAVVGTRPAVEVKPGKITLNVQNSLTAAGNSVYDILTQSAGVRVDNNDNISIIGRLPALITIDGKPTNLTGNDLAGILKSMQANTIDRIELITAGSAKYDASGGGIINIVLKKGQNTGANGAVTGTAGYGKYYKGSTGIVFNNRTDKLNIFGSYNYAANKTFHDFTTNRYITFNNTTSNYHVAYNSVQKNINNTFSLGTDYFISKNNTIGFLVNGYTTDDNFIKNNNLKIYNQAVFDSTITANSALNRQITHINYNLNYTGKLDAAGKTLSADLNYTTHNRSSAEFITNDFFDAAGNPYRAPLLLQNLSPSNIRILLSKVDFTDPLSKTSKLEAGIKYSDVRSSNNLVFGPKVNGVYQADPAFSSDFLYTENVNAAYVNYENKFDKFNLTAGLRAEQTIAKGNSVTTGQVVNNNYLNLFPQALLTYRYDDKNDFSISYNRGIKRPAYEDINPFLYYVDLYDYRAGNPNLQPEYANTIEISHVYNKTFVTTLYSTIISNAYNFDFYQQNDSSKINVKRPTNLGTIYNYGVKFFAPVVFTNWWNATFQADVSYQRYVAYPINGNLNKGTQDVIFSSTQNFIISNIITAEVSGFYESPTFYGITQLKANYFVNAGIGQQLFNKRASIKLNAADIFNTKRDRGQINYQNLNLATIDKKESQVVKLTFTYRFGKTSVKAATKHTTGNEDEQKRSGGAN